MLDWPGWWRDLTRKVARFLGWVLAIGGVTVHFFAYATMGFEQYYWMVPAWLAIAIGVWIGRRTEPQPVREKEDPV